MSKLYELSEQYKNISELLDDESQPQEIIEQALAQVEESFTEKVQSIAKLIQSLSSDANAYDLEANRLVALRRRTDKQIEHLKGYLSAEMEKSGITKVKGIFNVSIQQSSQPRLMIEDEAKIPECYYIAQPPKIDNAALKDNLKKGQAIPGATLEYGKYIMIR